MEASRAEDEGQRRQSMGVLVALYWKPIYKYIRLKWRLSPEDAEDLAQELFARVVEKDELAAFDPSRARFRTFLRTCADHLVANARAAARRQKRGGGAEHVPLATEEAEREIALAAPSGGAEEAFDREVLRSLFASALDAYRAECEATGRTARLRIFERYDLGDGAPTYAALADELGMTTTEVTNHLHRARRDFRRIVRATLRRASLTEEEFRREAEELGLDLP